MLRFVMGLVFAIASAGLAYAESEEIIACDSGAMSNSGLTASTYWTTDQFRCGQIKLNGASCLTAAAWDGKIWQYRNQCRRNRTGVTWTNVSRQIDWDIKLGINRSVWFVKTYIDDNNDHCFQAIALVSNKRHFIEYCNVSRNTPFAENTLLAAFASMEIAKSPS